MNNDYPFGGEPTRNELVAVGTSSVMVSPAHERQEIIIVNSSAAAQVITLSVGMSAGLSMGIPLQPWGVWYGSANSEFRVTSEAIYAISSAVSGQISIFER
jgi:hypothetical protein